MRFARVSLSIAASLSLSCAHTAATGPPAPASRPLAIIAVNDVYRVASPSDTPEGGLARVASLARDRIDVPVHEREIHSADRRARPHR